MFGIICSLTDDKKIAEEILADLFLHLKKESFFYKINFPLCFTLLRYTYNFAIKQLTKHNLHPKILNQSEKSRLIHLLCTKCNSLEETALILNITEEEVKQNLRAEFLNYRSKNSLPVIAKVV